MAPKTVVDLGVHLVLGKYVGQSARPMQVVLFIDEHGAASASLCEPPPLDMVGSAPTRLRAYLELQAREQSRQTPDQAPPRTIADEVEIILCGAGKPEPARILGAKVAALERELAELRAASLSR